jgi:hypothetical protein
MFDTSKGESQVRQWERLIAEFLHTNGRLKDAELVKVESNHTDWITGKYLKMVQTPIPPYK